MFVKLISIIKKGIKMKLIFNYILLLIVIILYSTPNVSGQDYYSVLLDPGHGGTDGGAPFVCSSTYSEKDINLYVGLNKTYYDILYGDPNWDVFITRNGDDNVSLNKRVQIANNSPLGQHDAFGNNIPNEGVHFFYEHSL